MDLADRLGRLTGRPKESGMVMYVSSPLPTDLLYPLHVLPVYVIFKQIILYESTQY